jgi:hypothetical protein
MAQSFHMQRVERPSEEEICSIPRDSHEIDFYLELTQRELFDRDSGSIFTACPNRGEDPALLLP